MGTGGITRFQKIPLAIFVSIIFLAAFLRLYGILWDQGYHLHPDERQIIMVADRLHLPQTDAERQTLFTPKSPLNPNFFAYGSFPIYLLKYASSWVGLDRYDGMLFVGRLLSALFDVGTVMVVYLIAKNLISKSDFGFRALPLLASFFYAISVLPIQSSHFFISDIPLTFLTTFTIYLLIRIGEKEWNWYPVVIGIATGLAIATKITAVLLFIPIGIALLFHIMRYRNWKMTLSALFFIIVFGALFFALTMPYALIDFLLFKTQMAEQTRMRVDPYIFPFTLQYVGSTPYWYFIKNLLLWGMGLPLGIASLLGFVVCALVWTKTCVGFARKGFKFQFLINNSFGSATILLSFATVYFLFMGNSAVKFMRYLLPIYPMLAIFAAYVLVGVLALFTRKMQKVKLKKIHSLFSPLYFLFLLSFLLWPLAFLSIYTHPHTRIEADQWIHENIPSGSTLAIEHWDDRLPLSLSEQYKFVEMTLYDIPDDDRKWDTLTKRLAQADYLIIASNRLWVPLVKLRDCTKVANGRCYPSTANYYGELFSGGLGFQKVAEFTSYPQLAVGSWQLATNDDGADESFTVYDHPKIFIFKNVFALPPSILFERITKPAVISP